MEEGIERKSPPARGAWIEISRYSPKDNCARSRPPHGGRGLKYLNHRAVLDVAPRSPPARGAWIEIAALRWSFMPENVAPRTGGVD